jgi:hypothetical protein
MVLSLVVVIYLLVVGSIKPTAGLVNLYILFCGIAMFGFTPSDVASMLHFHLLMLTFNIGTFILLIFFGYNRL